MKYEVWYIPTLKGIKDFKWRPKLISTHDNEEDANMDSYLSDVDEPAPDKHEYRGYFVIPVEEKAGEPDILEFVKEETFGSNPPIVNNVVHNNLIKGKAEIHFPKRFTLFIKLLSWLPTPVWTQLAQKMVKW